MTEAPRFPVGSARWRPSSARHSHAAWIPHHALRQVQQARVALRGGPGRAARPLLQPHPRSGGPDPVAVGDG